MAIVISPRVRQKLAEKHNVSEDEIRQCFINRDGDYLEDTREDHRSDPPTFWFVSETNRRRKLKVAFIPRKVETAEGVKVQIDIRTAYEANATEIEIYERYGRCE